LVGALAREDPRRGVRLVALAVALGTRARAGLRCDRSGRTARRARAGPRRAGTAARRACGAAARGPGAVAAVARRLVRGRARSAVRPGAALARAGGARSLDIAPGQLAPSARRVRRRGSGRRRDARARAEPAAMALPRGPRRLGARRARLPLPRVTA